GRERDEAGLTGLAAEKERLDEEEQEEAAQQGHREVEDEIRSVGEGDDGLVNMPDEQPGEEGDEGGVGERDQDEEGDEQAHGKAITGGDLDGGNFEIEGGEDLLRGDGFGRGGGATGVG